MRFWRRRRDEELNEEIESHLRMATRDRIDRGEAAEDAAAAARREFGNVGVVKEVTREMWGGTFLERLGQDLRYGLRMMGKHRGLTSVAVLSLALGVGANTALFSVVDAMLLKTLPVRDPERLVLFRAVAPPEFSPGGYAGYDSTDASGGRAMTSFPYQSYRRMRDSESVLSDVFAFGDVTVSVSADGQSSTANGQAVSGNYYSGLGVPAALGRVLDDTDDDPAASPVAVLSYRYWRQRFGGDPTVVGRPIDINKVPFTVVGVTPDGFEGTMQAGSTEDVTIAIAWESRLYADPKASRMDGAGQWWLRVMGRLKPEATAERARTQLVDAFRQSVAEHLEARRIAAIGTETSDSTDVAPSFFPRLFADSGARGEMDERKRYAPSLFLLVGVVGLLLLIACANVANLLLARATARSTEIGVRLALGASRARLVQQLLTESLLLACFGGALGIAFALWIENGLLAVADWGGTSMRGLDPHLDWRFLTFTAALSLLTGVVFGLAPALQSTRTCLTPALQHAGRGSSTPARTPLARWLLVLQIALSFVLLVGASLFVRTLANLRQVDTGFNPSNLLLFDVRPELVGYTREETLPLYERLADRLEAMAGVRSVTFSRVPLLARVRSTHSVYLDGPRSQTPGTDGKVGPNGQCNVNVVRENFLETMEIPLLAGRGLDARDDASAPRVVVVNRAFAERYFPGENPIGKRFAFRSSKPDPIEIVGLAQDAKYTRQREDVPPTAYIPRRQETADLGEVTFELRTFGDPNGIVAAVREAVSATDDSLPVTDVRTQVEEADRTLAMERLFAKLLALFGLLAETLAAIGLFGVMAYSVAQRTHEIAIRMALGADRAAVLKGVLRQGMTFAFAGTALGLAGALALTRVLENRLSLSQMLYGVGIDDSLSYVASVLLLGFVALLACLAPAWRATRVDPLTALRSE